MYALDEHLKEKNWKIPMISKPIGLRLTITLDNCENIKNELIKDLK